MANVVKFAIPERKIDNTGVTFSRSHDGYKHGDIRIRQNLTSSVACLLRALLIPQLLAG